MLYCQEEFSRLLEGYSLDVGLFRWACVADENPVALLWVHNSINFDKIRINTGWSKTPDHLCIFDIWTKNFKAGLMTCTEFQSSCCVIWQELRMVSWQPSSHRDHFWWCNSHVLYQIFAGFFSLIFEDMTFRYCSSYHVHKLRYPRCLPTGWWQYPISLLQHLTLSRSWPLWRWSWCCWLTTDHVSRHMSKGVKKAQDHLQSTQPPLRVK